MYDAENVEFQFSGLRRHLNNSLRVAVNYKIYELKDAGYFVYTHLTLRAFTGFVLMLGHMQVNKNKIFQSNVHAEINIINLQAKVDELR